MRPVRGWLLRWRGLLAACLLLYAFIVYTPFIYHHAIGTEFQNGVRRTEEERMSEANQKSMELKRVDEGRQNLLRPQRVNDVWQKFVQEARENKLEDTLVVNTVKGRGETPEQRKIDAPPKSSAFKFEFKPQSGESFVAERLLTVPDISFEERMKCNANANEPGKLILTINSGLQQQNLGGCPQWNCQVTGDRSKLPQADAILIMHEDGRIERNPNQYMIYFSQESPANSGYRPPTPDFFNMSFGFRHDTPSASPYGYTVKLAPESYKKAPFVNESLVAGKRRAAAWFVSHCSTASKREKLVEEMKKSIDVDIYGACGNMKCPRGGACEDMLDTEYHFYITFENSVCKDYITEKVWNQGYGRELVPVVLKRSLAEPYLPPNSFIAADDYATVDDLTAYMHYLMRNKTAYSEYFNWRRDHKVIFLNGRQHDVLERPWGMCQICRILWETPRPTHVIQDFHKWWDQSCEAQGELVDPILENTRKKNEKQKRREEEERREADQVDRNVVH